MSSHDGCSQGSGSRHRGRAAIAQVFGIDPGNIESLSWSLGNRVTTDNDASREFTLEYRGSNREITAFAVTEYTMVLRLRTPVGREKFYGVANDDVDDRPATGNWIHTA
ncbi:hypothetical protein [Natrialba taiwanensis]|uniref:hypothetical protein n=1 Tax=Natrialba taiwanensis TaxID=160846 RepID=UPI000677BAEC|nr:hypothetical protein [Natrialba taiwanensis]